MQSSDFDSQPITTCEWNAHRKYHTRHGVLVGLLMALPFVIALFLCFLYMHRLFNNEVRATDYYYHLSVQQTDYITNNITQ